MKRKNRLKWTIRMLVRTVLAGFIIFVTILLVRAFDTRKMPDLQVWHQVDLSNEFQRSFAGSEITFHQYQDLEDKLFAELDEKVFSEAGSPKQDKFNRYTRSSLSCPDRFSQNWNRSFELVPERIEGGILLIHGLTDSPYSMKDLAELFYQDNFYVLALRMPGHGTVPAGLTDVSWKDWIAALKIGARHVSQRAGSDHPFYIAGYSNGGALSLLYTLQSLGTDDFVSPDRVFLFSPAIGISKFAVMAQWLKLTSVVPYFEQSKWNSIAPEYDPFKYNSFPLNAAEQSRNLSIKVQKSVLACQKQGTLSKLPPVMTFQSAVDSTVIASDVVRFYEKLSPNGHELILFDTNQRALLQNFLKTSPLASLNESEASDKRNFTLAIITNKDADSKEIIARIQDENAATFNEVPLKMSWPDGIYSLSHLAIPFPMDDPLYGTDSVKPHSRHIQLGSINMRGERNVLRIPEKDLMRLRCNPFWDYVTDRIKKVIAEERQ
ncbi:MAG: alpha/beta hydrolase [Planctomycetota bacterium]|jgi:alpha-beta hydrolase superfamily lysophospholipase